MSFYLLFFLVVLACSLYISFRVLQNSCSASKFASAERILPTHGPWQFSAPIFSAVLKWVWRWGYWLLYLASTWLTKWCYNSTPFHDGLNHPTSVVLENNLLDFSTYHVHESLNMCLTFSTWNIFLSCKWPSSLGITPLFCCSSKSSGPCEHWVFEPSAKSKCWTSNTCSNSLRATGPNPTWFSCYRDYCGQCCFGSWVL